MSALIAPAPWTFRFYAIDVPENLRALGIEPVRLLTNEGQVAIMSADGERVALVDARMPAKRGERYKVQCDMRDAHGRLIAAAPDLLAALKDAVLEIARLHGTSGYLHYCEHSLRMLKIRAALAAAQPPASPEETPA